MAVSGCMGATFRVQGPSRAGGAVFMGRMTGIRRAAVLVLAASALAGCSTTDTLDSMLVDPSRYEGYNCKDLGNQLQTLNKREKDLRNLIDRADESASGVVIGAFAYRTDYQTVIADKKLLQRTMVEKKCQLTPSLTSDQIIR
ncbi:MAG: hypothetical protein WB624_26650 [Xanthobacteraceae bacterium]